MEECFLLHFAMMSECPRSILVLDDIDSITDDTTGLFDSIYKNVKVWVSGVGANRVLTPDLKASLAIVDPTTTVINIGLCGSINDNINVGSIVRVDGSFNMDYKVPGKDWFSSTNNKDDFTLDMERCAIMDKAFPEAVKASCLTSNQFVTKEYVDYMKRLVEGDNKSSSLLHEVVCDMELYYLFKLSRILHGGCYPPVISFKVVSDVVCKSDNYNQYEVSLKELQAKLYTMVIHLADVLGWEVKDEG